MKGKNEAIAAGVPGWENPTPDKGGNTSDKSGESETYSGDIYVQYTENNTFFSPRKGEFFKGNGDLCEKSWVRIWNRLRLKKKSFDKITRLHEGFFYPGDS